MTPLKVIAKNPYAAKMKKNVYKVEKLKGTSIII